MMKITEHIKKAVRIVALSGLACVSAGMLGGCTAEEDFAADERVTVTGIEVGIGDAVESRADAANESPDAKGYIGAEKIVFVATDKIEVKVGDGSPVTFTAESDGVSGLKWTTNSEIVLSKGDLNGAGIKITATHTATESGDDKPLGDDLTAENANVAFGASEPEDGSITIDTDGKLKIRFKHKHSLVSASVTTDMGTVASVVVNYDESQSVALNGSKAILPVGSVIESFTIKFSGDNAPSPMTLNIPSPVTTEANTHYPFKITASVGKTEVTLLSGNVLPGWSEGELSGGVIKIGSFAELAKIGAYGGYPADGHYVLTDDLDYTNDADLAGYNKPATGWKPISNFTGHFNGNGYTISNLTITPDDDDNQAENALFGKVSNGIIYDLHLDNATVTVSYIPSLDIETWAGVLVGVNHGRIDYCSVTNSRVTSKNHSDIKQRYAGSIAGENYGIITRSWCIDNAIEVQTTSNNVYAGGITSASKNNGVIIACYALGGSVKATNSASNYNSYAGGIVGSNNGDVMACYAKGANVTATNNNYYYSGVTGKAGAFCGANPGYIGYSYATTNVTGLKFSGTYNDADGSKVSDANGNYNVDVDGKEITTGTDDGYAALTEYDSSVIGIGSVEAIGTGALDLSDTGSAWLNKNIWVWPSEISDEAKKTTPPTIDMTYNGGDKKQ